MTNQHLIDVHYKCLTVAADCLNLLYRRTLEISRFTEIDHEHNLLNDIKSLENELKKLKDDHRR